MNDTVDKTALSLAVVEKKPQRPGGCVGIFFQLFDWNRRFAKKKLFSKKLHPPVRFKQASKKFGGDEKQPKLRLIADENSGGFPNAKNSNGAANVKNEQKNVTRGPGLIVRLMGLDSMPAIQREKSKKIPKSASVSGKAEKLVENKDELYTEKGVVKHELRPQKLQKTIVYERQPITKFGAEKLPFKNVLSKPRKLHTKLPSPVNSPRRKRSSKLIGAAARILEPGLQTSRSRCALTYSNTPRHPPQETHTEERIRLVSRRVEDSDAFGTVAVKGELSCRNCGYSLDDSTCDSTMSVQPLVFASPFRNCGGPSCSGRSKQGQTEFYQDLEEELHEEYPYKSPYTGRMQRHLGSQQCKTKGAPQSFSFSYKAQKPNQMLRAKERVPPRPNLSSVTIGKVSTSVMNGTNYFVSENQRLSCSTRPRVPTRMDNDRFQLEQRVIKSMNDSVPPGRKRRLTNLSRQGENALFTMSGEQLGNARLISHQKGRVGLVQGQDRTFNCGQGGNTVVSYPFNSHRSGTYEATEKSGLCCDGSLQKSDSGENSRRKTKFEKACPISGDALGALLEQKLKELNSQGEDTGSAPKKTTAMILQELIAALTLEVPFQQDNLPESPLSNSASFIHSQTNRTGTKLSVDLPLDSEYPSPGSVLEAHFSTESCPYSSLDESLGYKMPNEPELPNPNSELFNSTASLNTAESNKKLVIDTLNDVSEILCCINLASGFEGHKLEQAKEVLLNAELIFHNATTLSGSVAGRGSPIKCLLLDELKTLSRVLWMNFGCCLGIEDGKGANQIKAFVLDLVIEYLGVKFQGYPHCGSKLTRKLPLRGDNLLEIVEVVGRWEGLSRLGLDELIEREMSRSLGEWTECESEAFETRVDISRYVLQSLVDEIVMDLWKW